MTLPVKSFRHLVDLFSVDVIEHTRNGLDMIYLNLQMILPHNSSSAKRKAMFTAKGKM